MSEFVTVRRGGGYLTIPAEAVDRYMAKGYDVVDSNGNILKESTPNDINALKRAYENHVAEIKKLKAEIAELKSQQTAEPVKQSEVSEEEIVEKKATSKKTKKSV